MRYLDTNGDGTGTKNAIGDYSVTPTPFYTQPAAYQTFVLHDFVLQLSDNGQFGQSVYGSMAAALTNGLLVRIKRGSTIMLDLLNGLPIKINDHFAHISHQMNLISWAGAINSLSCLIELHESGGPYVLEGAYGDRLEVLLNDNFTTLVDQTFFIMGRIR